MIHFCNSLGFRVFGFSCGLFNTMICFIDMRGIKKDDRVDLIE